MGMWVRAGETLHTLQLKDVPEPQYTTENEARRIKSSRVDWRSSWLHEQCMGSTKNHPQMQWEILVAGKVRQQMKVQQEVDDCILVEEAVLTISRRGLHIVEVRTVMV